MHRFVAVATCGGSSVGATSSFRHSIFAVLQATIDGFSQLDISWVGENIGASDTMSSVGRSRWLMGSRIIRRFRVVARIRVESVGWRHLLSSSVAVDTSVGEERVLQYMSHGTDSLLRVMVKETLQQVTAELVLGDMLESLLEASIIPKTNLADFSRAHGTLATTRIRTKRNSGDSFVKGDSIRPDVVGSVSWDGHYSSNEALLAHGNTLVLDNNRFRWMIESASRIRLAAEGDTSSNTKKLPPTSKLSDVVGTKVAMDDSMLVKMQQRDPDTLERLSRETLARLAHVEHEIFGGSIRTLHGNTVSRLGHSFGVSSMLDSVVYTNNSWNIVSGKVEVLSDLELALDNFGSGSELGNDLLALFPSNET